MRRIGAKKKEFPERPKVAEKQNVIIRVLNSFRGDLEPPGIFGSAKAFWFLLGHKRNSPGGERGEKNDERKTINDD